MHFVDIIVTNNPANMIKTEVIPTSIGDHDMVGCVRKLNNASFKPRKIMCRDYRSYHPEAMNEELETVDWSAFYSCRTVNEAWSQMKDILLTIFEHHAPKICKKVRGKPAPWLTSNVKKLMNVRDKLLRKSRRTKAELDISKYKQKRNEVNIAIRKAKSSYHQSLLKENSANPNQFWKTIKSIYPTKANEGSSMHTFDFQGEKTNDAIKVANGFCNFFTTVITTLRERAIPLCNFAWKPPRPVRKRTDKKFNFRPVSKLEVEKYLRYIKRNKSTGIDNLPPCLLKDAARTISAPLTHLINLSLQTGLFPKDWKLAKIVPIHKSGSHSSFDNYRPISVLPVLSKIIEKAVHRQVIEFIEQNKLLSAFQFGFRPKLSTELAVTLLLDDIRKNVDEGKLVGATFIDLRKAFDTISHSNLLDKLSQYGIRDVELNWFTDYLFNRSVVVSYDNCLSNANDVLTGVPQGSILGPLLFIIFLNDITDVISSAKIIKYADDTVIYVADKDIKVIKTKLSNDMNAIADWLDQNALIINLNKGKTESLLFGTSQRIAKQSESFNVMYRGSNISNTTLYKYLGIEVDSSLSLNSHFEKCYKRASGRLRLLAKLRDYLDVTSAKSIYRLMILPTFTYCGILQLKLTTTQSNRLASFYDRSLKVIQGNTSAQSDILSVINANNIRACKLVRKCSDKEACDIFRGYFEVQEHETKTRNNQCLLKLPRIKTEYARKSFRFMGAKIYNELPIEIRKTESFSDYSNLLKKHFSY